MAWRGEWRTTKFLRCIERRALVSLCVSQLKIIEEDQRIGIHLADKSQPVELVPMVARKWQLVEVLVGWCGVITETLHSPACLPSFAVNSIRIHSLRGCSVKTRLEERSLPFSNHRLGPLRQRDGWNLATHAGTPCSCPVESRICNS